MFGPSPRHLRESLASPFALVCLVLGCQSGQTITLGRGPEGDGGSGGSDDSSGSEGGNENGNEGGSGSADTLPSIELTAGNPRVIVELSDPEKDDNPTLTADELELCLTSKRDGGLGGSDIWCTQRTARELPFGPLSSVTLLSSDGFDSSAALALDGLSMWFGSRRDDGLGGVDIFESTRATRTSAWSEPSRNIELSSEFDDIPRPVAMNDTVMPLGSRRGGDGYQTYLSERDTPESPFQQPTGIAELLIDGVNIIDAFLTEDGQLLLFKADGDLCYAYRETLSSPFSAPQEILGVNSPDEDRDPWLSADGRRLYFSSDRAGDFEIYIADVEITAREP